MKKIEKFTLSPPDVSELKANSGCPNADYKKERANRNDNSNKTRQTITKVVLDQGS